MYPTKFSPHLASDGLQTNLTRCFSRNVTYFRIYIFCASIFLAMSHAIIESKTHVGWQNEITRANVDPRYPRVFRGVAESISGNGGVSDKLSDIHCKIGK